MIITVYDKTGRNIYLTKERWVHILKHPEMADSLERVKETLEMPIVLRQFSYDEYVHYYYRFYKDKGYLFISVRYLNGKGFIITAFYTNKIA